MRRRRESGRDDGGVSASSCGDLRGDRRSARGRRGHETMLYEAAAAWAAVDVTSRELLQVFLPRFRDRLFLGDDGCGRGGAQPLE